MTSEYEVLLGHLDHDVYLVLPGYDAPVFLRCRNCDIALLGYGDPEQMAIDEFLEEDNV